MFLLQASKPLSLDEAKYLFHAIEGAIVVHYFCVAKDFSDEWSILPINEIVASIKPPWTLGILLQNAREEISSGYFSEESFENYFGTSTIENYESLKQTIRLVVPAWEDSKVYKAISFLYKSVKELGVDLCDWRENGYDESFETYINDGARESAFQNAYKAVEAILGDLGGERKRENRIIMRLRDVGINPNRHMSLRGETLKELLAKYALTRDKITAHGSVSKRRLPLAEIIGLQADARYILLKSI